MIPPEELVARLQAMRVPVQPICDPRAPAPPESDDAADGDQQFEPNLMVTMVARPNHQPATGSALRQRLRKYSRPATGAVDVQPPDLAPPSQPPRRPVQNNMRNARSANLTPLAQPPRRLVQNNKENTRTYPDDLAWIREEQRAGNAVRVPVVTRRPWIPMRRHNVQRHMDPSEFSQQPSRQAPPPQVADSWERRRQGHLTAQQRMESPIVISQPEEDPGDRRRWELFEEALRTPIPEQEEGEAERDERRQTLLEEALKAGIALQQQIFDEDDLESESYSPSSDYTLEAERGKFN